jgi:competence protein ComEA
VFKKILAFAAAMYVAVSFAAVDVNKASEAELDGIKHIGPATSKQIIAERKKSEFKSWEDFMARIKGVKEKRAAEFSAAGLTVGGAAYTGAAPAAKKDAKAEAKKEADKKTKADADNKAKEDAKKAKDVKPAAKDEKKDAKAEAAKPAASAASAAKK